MLKGIIERVFFYRGTFKLFQACLRFQISFCSGGVLVVYLGSGQVRASHSWSIYDYELNTFPLKNTTPKKGLQIDIRFVKIESIFDSSQNSKKEIDFDDPLEKQKITVAYLIVE